MKAVFVDKRTDDLENYLLDDLVVQALALKVDKVEGKTLSSVDFTTDDKANLDINNLKVSFPEAPINDKEYTRKNAEWVESSAATGGDKNYIHNQITAASTWIVTHNLNKYPSISIVDTGGNIVIGEVLYDSLNQVTLTFTAEFSGKAYFN